MIIKVTKSMFIDEFKAIRPGNFTYDALSAMFDYFDEYECEPDMELDVIGICCEFSEYTDIADYNEQYSTEYSSTDELQYETTVIMVDDVRFVAVDR